MKNFYSPYDIMLLLLFYFHSLHSAKLIEMCIRSQGYIQKATTKKKHAYDYLFWLEKKMFSNCWSCGSQIWRQPPATKICCKFYKSFWKTFLQNTSGQPYLAHFPLSLASPTQSQVFAMIFLIYFFYLPNIFQTIVVSTCNLNPLRALMQIIQILSRTIIHRNYCKRIVLTIFSKPGFYVWKDI